ncbi:unnamed protein product [Toxocara canis]|uniref:Uncharacterized protein n=1 Tax=Toxocara canis TaxID=6265 RepID=A0A3P7IUI3_TOXCA|nr:unnamed protein product [Toxocara canis]
MVQEEAFGGVTNMDFLNNGWANTMNNMNMINQSGTAGNVMDNRVRGSASYARTREFNSAQFGSWGNNYNFNSNNAGWGAAGNTNFSNDNFGLSYNNNNNNANLQRSFSSLNQTLSNNLNNLARNLTQLNNISANWNLNLSRLNNRGGGFGGNNNAWFTNTQWSSTGDGNRRGNISGATGIVAGNSATLGNQTGMGVPANASGTRIIIGNGTTGNLLEHANWPSSVYVLDANANL